MRGTLAKIAAAVSIVIWLLAFAPPAWSVDGEAVVTGKCTACHGNERIKAKRLSTGEWAILVDKEIERGAQLNTEERNAAIAYLSATYGTSSSPSAAPVAEPVAPTPDVTATPTEQAYTGVELWQFLLAGGTLLGGGAILRRRR